MTLGLGKAKDSVKTDTAEPTPSTSHETSIPTKTDTNASRRGNKQHEVPKSENKTLELSTCTPFTIDVVRLNPKMKIPHVVSPEELASCPQSIYREPGYQKLLYNPIMSDKDSVHSDSTENYWPEYAAEHPEILLAANPNTTTLNHTTRKNKAKFKLLMHGIHKR